MVRIPDFVLFQYLDYFCARNQSCWGSKKAPCWTKERQFKYLNTIMIQKPYQTVGGNKRIANKTSLPPSSFNRLCHFCIFARVFALDVARSSQHQRQKTPCAYLRKAKYLMPWDWEWVATAHKQFLVQAYKCVLLCLSGSLFAFVSNVACSIYDVFYSGSLCLKMLFVFSFIFIFVQDHTPLKLWTNLTQSGNVERSLTESLKSLSAVYWGHRKRKMRLRDAGEQRRL